MSLIAGVLLGLLLVVGGVDAAAVVGHVWVVVVGRVGVGMATNSLKRAVCMQRVSIQLRPVHCMLV